MNLERKYIKPSISPLNMDLYIIRCGIMTELKSALPKLSGTLLDVGCGFSPYKSLVLSPLTKVQKYIGLDLEDNTYQRPDLTWDGTRIPMETDSVDCVLMTEVLEHCPEPEQVLKEVNRVLKPSGVIFLTTPFIWPLHDTPWDYYRFTPYALKLLLTRAGFVGFTIKPIGGWNASLAQLLGLWARRRPMPKLMRIVLTALVYPLWASLVIADKVPKNFPNNSFFCGLSVIATKRSSDEIV